MNTADKLAWLIAICCRHRLFIEAITALAAGLLGVITLLLGRKTLREERWIFYFGISFLILAMQYGILSFLELRVLFHLWPSAAVEPWYSEWFLRLCSAVNNVFFLAAGTALWRPDWKRRFWYWCMVTVIAGASVAMAWAGWLSPWHRSLDGLLSAFAAGSLGVGFFVNASPRRRLWLMVVAASGAILYAFLSVAVALAPAAAEGLFWSDLSWRVSGALGASGQTPPAELLNAFDSFLIAIALVLKVLLALGAYTLIVRALVMLSPRVLAEILKGVSRDDLDYFGSDGLVRAIGMSLRADSASICLRMPGTVKEISRIEWPRRRDLAPAEVLPPPNDGREGQVLAEGRTVANPTLGKMGHSGKTWWRRFVSRPVGRSLISSPVLYHGTVIGSLTVEWDHPHAYTNTAVHQMERLAEMVATSIESRRRLFALVYWGHRLQELNLQTVPPTYRNMALILARKLYETLAPLAIGLRMTVGFEPVWAIAGERGTDSGFCKDLDAASFERALHHLAGPPTSRFDRVDVTFGESVIGRLEILWPDINSAAPIFTPLVRSDELHLKSMVPPIANAVVRTAEAAFFHRLNDLQTVLIRVHRREEWLEAVENAILGSKLLWVVAWLPAGGEIFGKGPYDLIREFAPAVFPDEPLWHGRVEPPRDDTHHLVRLLLLGSGVELWIGAGNLELGPEITATWPWRSFLERLAGAADAAWIGFSTSEELAKVREEAGQIRGLLHSTVDTGAFIHAMRNIARNFKLAAQSLGEARRLGVLWSSIDIERDIFDMQKSAERLYELADKVLKPSALDGRSVYLLADLVQEVADLFEPILHQADVSLFNEVPADLQVATASYAVHIALMGLISNSIEAIGSGGTIRVVGIPSSPDGKVLCHVIDDGPGIGFPEPRSVFELGTSKKGDGSGLGIGLYMIRKLIEGAGAEIYLTSTRKGQTTFTLRLRLAPRRD